MSGKVRKEYVKTCAACPATFVAYHPNARYCPECRTVNKRHITPSVERTEKELKALSKTKGKKKPLSLTEAAALARKAGMTYGQYIAKMERGE